MILNDLADVNAPAPDDRDRLAFDLASGMWVPRPFIDVLYGGRRTGAILVDETVLDGQEIT